MKYFDKVEVINDDKYYAERGVHKGMIGIIFDPEIRFGTFDVNFEDPKWHDPKIIKDESKWHLIEDDILIDMRIRDLKVVEESDYTDEKILLDLPNNDPRWWCKYEDGYVYNLAGDKMKLEDMKTFLG